MFNKHFFYALTFLTCLTSFSYQVDVFNVGSKGPGEQGIVIWGHPENTSPVMLAKIPYGAKGRLEYPKPLEGIYAPERDINITSRLITSFKRDTPEARRMIYDGLTSKAELPNDGGTLYILSIPHKSWSNVHLVAKKNLRKFYETIFRQYNYENAISSDVQLHHLVKWFIEFNKAMGTAKQYQENELVKFLNDVKWELTKAVGKHWNKNPEELWQTAEKHAQSGNVPAVY